MSIQADIKASALPAYVELFELDLSVLGGEKLYFTPNTNNGQAAVSFGGVVYIPLPITGNGWATGTEGAAPQPTLTVSNVARFIQPYLTAYDDLVGAKLTRKLTFSKYLDSGATPDGSQVFDTSVFLIEQLSKLNKLEVEFRLSSVIDAPNFKLPRGQVLRTTFPGAGLFKK